MAAVVEVNVSPQIDDLTNSMDFYEGKRPAIWKRIPYSFLRKDSRRQQRLEREREHGL